IMILLGVYVLSSEYHFLEVISLLNNFLSPLGQSRLMKGLGELQDFSLGLWYDLYRMFFICFSAGILLLQHNFSRSIRVNPWVVLIAYEILLITTVYRNTFKGVGDILYLSAIVVYAGFVIGLYVIAHMNGKSSSKEMIQEGIVILIAWFTLSLFFTRGAARYNFFFAPSAIICGTYALGYIYRRFCHPAFDEKHLGYMVLMLILWESYVVFQGTKVYFLICASLLSLALLAYVLRRALFVRRKPLNMTAWLCFTGFMIALTSFIPVVGAEAQRASRAAKRLHPIASNSLKRALDWMKNHLPDDAVIAADFNLGSHINTLANKATIVDEDHYIPYWIYLISRHVFCGQTEMEALQFLKTHRASYLMIDQRDFDDLSRHSALGSDERYDRLSTFVRVVELSLPKADETDITLRAVPPLVYLRGLCQSPFEWVKITLKKPGERRRENIKGVYVVSNGNKLPPQLVFFRGKLIQQVSKGAFPGVLMLYFAKGRPARRRLVGIYFPEKAWKMLLVQLYVMERPNKYFKLVYPSPSERESRIGLPPSGTKIWQILYPKNLKEKPEYLATKFEDSALYKSWMLGLSPE
ncbi:hypothetical protein J7M22_06950, partial [Candidatus Poribacteria bacterium]|nr:hypothetical protein [Candidatus Poribacteria bacterium]